ncbi:MAG: hypothetical protein DSZ28_03040 [Thiothrix sp.]|nr:MAG: hypothetical protein DSZ28_03040 [Thiothrix sp.]
MSGITRRIWIIFISTNECNLVPACYFKMFVEYFSAGFELIRVIRTGFANRPLIGLISSRFYVIFVWQNSKL